MDWASCLEDGNVATLRCIPIVLKNVINWAFIFAAVVAVVVIIYAGFRFVTSKGDPQAVDEAKKIMTYAIIGLLIVLLSFGVINIIAEVTGVGGLINPSF